MFSNCFQIETHHQSSSRLDTPKGGVWLALKQRESSQSFQKEPESSLNHHSINIAKFYQHHQVLSTSPSYINITTIWRQKRRQEWSHKWRRGNGHKDYVLVAYLYVVFGWGSTQLSTRLPDIEYYCIIIATQTRASLHHHKSIIARASLPNIYCSSQNQHLSTVHGWSLHELKWHLKSSRKSSGCDALTRNGRLFQELLMWYLGLVLSLTRW